MQAAKPALGRLNPPVIRTNSTLDYVESGCRVRTSQNDDGFRAISEQFAAHFAGVVGVGAMNHVGAHQQAGFRGVQGCNPSSPSPQTPRPKNTGIPHHEIEFPIRYGGSVVRLGDIADWVTEWVPSHRIRK